MLFASSQNENRIAVCASAQDIKKEAGVTLPPSPFKQAISGRSRKTDMLFTTSLCCIALCVAQLSGNTTRIPQQKAGSIKK